MRLPQRKLLAWLTTMIAICCGFLVCAFWPALVAVFPTFCGSLVGLSTSYSAANIIQKATAKPVAPESPGVG